MSRCMVEEAEQKQRKKTSNIFSSWLIPSAGRESHQATTCCRPVRIHVPLRLPSDPQPSHPLLSLCVCAGSSLCECVYFRVCDSRFLYSANEAKLYGTAGPPFILNSLFLFLFLSLALSRVAPLIGLAWALRNAGACLNGCHSGIHLQRQHSGTLEGTGSERCWCRQRVCHLAGEGCVLCCFFLLPQPPPLQ